MALWGIPGVGLARFLIGRGLDSGDAGGWPEGRPLDVMDRTKERLAAGKDSRPGSGPMLAGEVMGSALLRVRPSEFPALRKRPGPVPEGWSRTPPSLLRYSDEQTVVGTAAVFAAIAGMRAVPEAFEPWGAVAASRYLGRASLAAALRNFKAEGVWGISPHLIPHFALHSPSGTISLALGLHGPNVGAGGGLHGAAEGFLAALTWLAAGVVPGVWLVLSGWSPELIPERKGGASATGRAPEPPAAEVECQALALALRPVGTASGAAPARHRFRVRIDGETASEGVKAPVDLVRLAGALEMPGERADRTVATDPVGRVRVELVGGCGEAGY